MDQSKMERLVAVASHAFGVGVQSIVISAKAKSSNNANDGEWKTELLQLLGQIPPSSTPAEDSFSTPTKQPPPRNAASSKPATAEIDVLLQNSKCDKFVLRCIENDLPPNLIHCLRLLRVLELQHANTASAKSSSDTNEASPGETTAKSEIQPLSIIATSKVSRLLCILCTDTSVGEQLRPHLFGLLALSGASYPPSGVHVAQAASEVICQLAAHCLTRNLVWFIHDRKMMVHMTDDVKELSGMAASANATASATVVPMGLVGHEAERSGLMVIALRTVITMVYESLRFETVDLVKDFEMAGGFDVFHYAVLHATGKNGKGLLELVPQLVCCPNEVLIEDDDGGDLRKLASNPRVFSMLADLMTRSNPLLLRKRLAISKELSEDDQEIELQRFIDQVLPEDIANLAALSIRSSAKIHLQFEGDAMMVDHKLAVSYDLSYELFPIMLQLFAEHPNNYEILEERLHLLTFALLSFPCYEDPDIKKTILKILEFVLTAVGVGDEVTPVHACVEIFFVLCLTLLKESIDLNDDGIILTKEQEQQVLDLIVGDAFLMGSTLEKLLQFDQRVAPLMVESGLLSTNLDSVLALVTESTVKRIPAAGCVDQDTTVPSVTSQDKTFAVVCRVLKLIVADQPVNFSKQSLESPFVLEKTNLHRLLRLAVKTMGTEASIEACGVFEGYMLSFSSAEGLENDMLFVLAILEDLTKCLALNNTDMNVLKRSGLVLTMLRSVLESKSMARNSFRECGGFDVILRLVLSLKRVVSISSVTDLCQSALELIQSVMGLLDAAIGMKSRNPLTANEISPLSITADVNVDWVSSQLSSESASSLNRNYIRHRSYYLNLAAAIAATDFLGTTYAEAVIDVAFGHMDPDLKISTKALEVQAVRNPDAIRLALGIALFMPDARSGNDLSTQILDRMHRLCENDRSASTLPQIASCGLCYSLTNPHEFGPVLFDYEHNLQTRFSRILCRVAAYSMSYTDFVGILRNVAGPILCADGSDDRIRLPVISSSIKKRATVVLTSADEWSADFEQRDNDFSLRLRAVCDIARNAESCARVRVGGDTINTIAVLMHQVRLEDRLRVTAEEGRLKYIEIESIDASALNSDMPAISNVVGSPPKVPEEKLWSPLSASGFTFSIWLRHMIPAGSAGNLYILDFCNIVNPSTSSTPQGTSFLSVWYDLQNQRFNVISSASYRGEPTCFPVSPLRPGEWHHILVTYTPAKRGMITRKSVFSIFVDGRPLEAEVRVESVNLPPNARVVIGAPNAALAVSGILRGSLPEWEVGPMLLLSTVLLDLDATAIYTYGPAFPSLLWGDRPQRLSLASTGTVAFTMLANTGEKASIALALRKRDIAKLESAGYSTMAHKENDDLSVLGLLCRIPPDCVVFGFQALTTVNRMRNEALKKDRRIDSERLVNLARLNYGNESASTDAIAYGKGTLVAPLSFQDCLRWVGGPPILFPLVNASNSPSSLALSLQMIRLGSRYHRPNLESLQAGGGYRMLSVLLQGKGVVDESCLDQCFAFATDGYDPDPASSLNGDEGVSVISSQIEGFTDWLFIDLDAMKHLVLNHQVWDLRKFGPGLPLRLLALLNRLVDHRGAHKAFNARRLHQVGIVRWTLHLAIEAAELYTIGDILQKRLESDGVSDGLNPWLCECPRVADVSVGGDPGNPFLLECKNLLRRVLTFMLTPGDLKSLVESIVFTISRGSTGSKGVSLVFETQLQRDDSMLPGPIMRLHLVRLIEELIVDGVNEIVAISKSDDQAPPHAGGVASPNQLYFTSASARGRTVDGTTHPKHQQAQNFLAAFANCLTPVWFATVLEGCQEEASASASLRLMILLLQGSSVFESAFRNGGAFAPFVLSVPRYSTCPGIALVLLSQLLNVPILHLHSLPTLDPDQLCEVFDAEGDDMELPLPATHVTSDSSSGIFALIVECVGRNIQHIKSESLLSAEAAATNKAIFRLLSHRHQNSPTFRQYCRTPSFLEPLSQALCLVYDERLQPLKPSSRSKRASLLSNVPKDLTPTERYVGSHDDQENTGMGIVRLIRLIISDSVVSGPRAALPIRTIFRSFPIHASSQQVEAFHLVVVEHCCSVIDGVLSGGQIDPVTVANCVGICSVFLDHEVSALFTSEAALKTVKMTISILNALLRFETPVIYSLGNVEHSLLTKDASYLAGLACVTSLRIGLPYNIIDRGDEDLQSMILSLMDTSIDSLLLLPSRDRKSNWKVPTGKVVKPAPNSKQFDLWESSSVARCCPDRPVLFPDLFAVGNPDVVVVAPLLVSLHKVLLGTRDDVRSLAISILVSLLQHRSGLLSELLVAEVKRNGRTETIDVVNRGGFKALLLAHEAAAIVDSKNPSSISVKKKYASFFEWIEKNNEDVQLVFDEVDKKVNECFPCLKMASTPHSDAVENEQKSMLLSLSSRSSDRSAFGGLERAELSRVCSETTSEIHSQWKRQGFDDLAYGAMKWKILLRQLKGSVSIWEGGISADNRRSLSLTERLGLIEAGNTSATRVDPPETVKRWKLDLTESYERQRRRFLPNYEFHGLYNLDEENDAALTGDAMERLSLTEDDFSAKESDEFFIGGVQMEATAALLKDLNIKRTLRSENDEEFDETDHDFFASETATEATSVTTMTHDHTSIGEDISKLPDLAQDGLLTEKGNELATEEKDASSYELITGLLQAGDWPEKSYNVSRCTGLEVTKSLFLWCGNSMYVIDGFEQSGGGGMEGKISRVERERSSFHISLRQKDSKVYHEEKTEDEIAASIESGAAGNSHSKREQLRYGQTQQEEPNDDVIYEHRSQRILLTELYSVYRRRYQLQQNGLEFYDVHRNSVLISFATHLDREEVLSKVLQSSIPNSIFSSSYGTYINYTKFMKNLQAKITSQWQNGKMTNFEFLMQLNSLAGRSFNDLTQYPVFPWVIADYDSEEIDLSDPKTYRDLSKPMGALGEDRAQQFRDRYEALASTYFGEDDPPPFHYGTHYSCAAYVLYYLMRLEPFSRLALALQGGRFDVADRLFHDVGRSWKSASEENLQDVRELIPEFYYLPDFLMNTNDFDFGETQRGKTVHNVSLPRWAKGDPKRFIRINRQALESEYVSKNLHLWIDLVFGWKQRGEAAVEALNTFVHVTYEGEVDIDAMTDPIQRQSTIAQIQNFGQTPSRLERKPFPSRTVVRVLKDKSIDLSALPALAPLTPPLCVAGVPYLVSVKCIQTETCKLGLLGPSDKSVGDICLIKGQVMALGMMCTFNLAAKCYFSFGGLNNGVSVHTATPTSRFRESNKLISIHDDLHRAPISAAKASLNGNWLITGSVDSTLRVWAYDGTSLLLRATLCGHDGSHIKCIDVSTECGVIVSGCGNGRVVVWDLRTLIFVRLLRQPSSVAGKPVISVSINHKNGNILTLVGSLLSLFDINGNCIAQEDLSSSSAMAVPNEIGVTSSSTSVPTCAVATDCPEWMTDGIVAVSGHANGDVRLYGLESIEDGPMERFVMRQVLDTTPHKCAISSLRVTGVDRPDTLLIGDRSGRVSVCKASSLDQYSADELMHIVADLSRRTVPILHHEK
jgi:Beige/BEACH domain/PH domain associated with Beige/BEACH